MYAAALPKSQPFDALHDIFQPGYRDDSRVSFSPMDKFSPQSLEGQQHSPLVGQPLVGRSEGQPPISPEEMARRYELYASCFPGATGPIEQLLSSLSASARDGGQMLLDDEQYYGLRDTLESSENLARFTLIVNVPPVTTRSDLIQTFKRFGQVELAMVVCDKKTRHPNREWTATAGYAFVRFTSSSDARAALAAVCLGLVRVRGSRVRATWAKKDSYCGKNMDPDRGGVESLNNQSENELQHNNNNDMHANALSPVLPTAVPSMTRTTRFAFPLETYAPASPRNASHTPPPPVDDSPPASPMHQFPGQNRRISFSQEGMASAQKMLDVYASELLRQSPVPDEYAALRGASIRSDGSQLVETSSGGDAMKPNLDWQESFYSNSTFKHLNFPTDNNFSSRSGTFDETNFKWNGPLDRRQSSIARRLFGRKKSSRRESEASDRLDVPDHRRKSKSSTADMREREEDHRILLEVKKAALVCKTMYLELACQRCDEMTSPMNVGLCGHLICTPCLKADTSSQCVRCPQAFTADNVVAIQAGQSGLQATVFRIIRMLNATALFKERTTREREKESLLGSASRFANLGLRASVSRRVYRSTSLNSFDSDSSPYPEVAPRPASAVAELQHVRSQRRYGPMGSNLSSGSTETTWTTLNDWSSGAAQRERYALLAESTGAWGGGNVDETWINSLLGLDDAPKCADHQTPSPHTSSPPLDYTAETPNKFLTEVVGQYTPWRCDSADISAKSMTPELSSTKPRSTATVDDTTSVNSCSQQTVDPAGLGQ